MFRFDITIPKEYFKSIEYYMKGVSDDFEEKLFKKEFNNYEDIDYIIVSFKKTGSNHNVDMSIVIYSKRMEVYYVTYGFEDSRDILGIYNIVDIGLADILLKKKEYEGLEYKLKFSTINIETDVNKDADYYKDIVVNYELSNPEKVKAILLHKNFSDNIELAQSVYTILFNYNIFNPASNEYDIEFIHLIKDKLSYFGYDEDYIDEPKSILRNMSEFILLDYLIKALLVVYKEYSYSSFSDLLSDFYNEYINKLHYEGYFENN